MIKKNKLGGYQRKMQEEKSQSHRLKVTSAEIKSDVASLGTNQRELGRLQEHTSRESKGSADI